MSMELLAFFILNNEPTLNQLNIALMEERIEIVDSATVDLHTVSGFLPMYVQGKPSGIFFYRGNSKEIVSETDGYFKDIDRNSVYYFLGYGTRTGECTAAFTTAYILSKKYDALIYESESATFMNREIVHEAISHCDLGIADLESDKSRISNKDQQKYEKFYKEYMSLMTKKLDSPTCTDEHETKECLENEPKNFSQDSEQNSNVVPRFKVFQLKR